MGSLTWTVLLLLHLIRPSMAFHVQKTSWSAYHPLQLVHRRLSICNNDVISTTMLESSRSSWENDTQRSSNSNDTVISSFCMESDHRLTAAYRPDNYSDNYSNFTTVTQTNRTNSVFDDDTLVPRIIMTWMNGTDILPRLLQQQQYRLPPFLVEDWNVLLYDLLLMINLVVSISFWVVHRMDISYIGLAFNEGCLLSLLWIIAGLFNGSFLYTAIDGHQRPNHNNSKNSIMSMRITTNNVNSNQGMNTTDATKSDVDVRKNDTQRPNDNRNSSAHGGPIAAGLLALHTYINTMNLRLVYALIVAMLEHRSALSNASELLIPLEFGYGLVLMILWRTLHSSYVLR